MEAYIGNFMVRDKRYKRRRKNESFRENLDYVTKEVGLSLIGLAVLVVIFIIIPMINSFTK